ncbi:hypothetical protein [Altererythrobacter sp. Root672]|uniref:hypothetical protein n=1 Tax=Altererythrobacter sp. Root672 TaxID=1736584 RepID=UPI00070204B6|nr:hypothetical protein [Altererythrobacter sp. Root672]KRA80546.1 hypothetical protein ASD76_15405 [Altererythrobacter sp. Root672]
MNLLTPIAVTPSATDVPAFPGAERQVEFVGPPGVGKSAIYHAVRDRLGSQSIYRTAQEGRFLAAKASLGKVSPLRRPAYRAVFQLPRVGEFYARRLAVASSEDTLRQALQLQGAFLECCSELAQTGFGDPLARFSRLPIMLDELRDLHLWTRLPGNVQVLQPDGLVQKGWVSAPQSREAYFSSVPKPGAVVVVTASPDVIVDRLRTRGRRIHAHVGLSDSELHAASVQAAETFALATELLRRRGVPVFEVDGEAPLSESTERVAELLRNRVAWQEAG